MVNKSDIGYLKRVINRTHKMCIGEKTGGTATIADLAKLFKLPLDEENLADYEIKSFDSEIPSIEILCKKNNSTYYAEFSASSELLSYFGGEEKFINHIINYSDTHKRETTHSLWHDEIYYDRFSIKINDNQTVRINRFGPNPYSTFSPEFTQTSISLYNSDSKNLGNIDYSIRSPRANAYEFEMETVGWNKEYQYKLNNGIVYVLEEHSDKVYAVVFVENVFKGIDHYISLNYHIEGQVKAENESLTNDQVYSVINLYGPTCTRIHIFKECEFFKVKYSTRKSWDDPEENVEYLIPVLNSCDPIDYMECEYLANELKKYISNEELVKLVCEKLHEIKFRLMISKGLAKKEETVLSIEKYMKLPFDEAVKLFAENKDEIFGEIMKKLAKNH